MNHLPASSRNPAGSRVRVAAHERLSGRSRSLRVDRSTIKSPTPGPGPCTQIRQGVRGAITIGSRPTRNHSPPRAQSPLARRRHDVQIRRGPPSSGQLQSQTSGASGEQPVRLGARLIDERPDEHPRRTPTASGTCLAVRRIGDPEYLSVGIAIAGRVIASLRFLSDLARKWIRPVSLFVYRPS